MDSIELIKNNFHNLEEIEIKNIKSSDLNQIFTKTNENQQNENIIQIKFQIQILKIKKIIIVKKISIKILIKNILINLNIILIVMSQKKN